MLFELGKEFEKLLPVCTAANLYCSRIVDAEGIFDPKKTWVPQKKPQNL